MTPTNAPTYPMNQLSLAPSKLRMNKQMLLPCTFGKGEQETMAALLITMMQEDGDVWRGVTVQELNERAQVELQKIAGGEDGAMLFRHQPHNIFNFGLAGLCERGFLRIEQHGKGDEAFDVLYPTESLLRPLGNFVVD